MDTYQAVYDAVRSRISIGDVGVAVENAIRGENIGHFMQMAAESVRQAASAYESPAAIYRPALSIDGNQWCALYGANLQDGVAGFGDSPALAMADFDRNWFAKLPARVALAAAGV
jgi:hypothetical protein